MEQKIQTGTDDKVGQFKKEWRKMEPTKRHCIEPTGRPELSMHSHKVLKV